MGCKFTNESVSLKKRYLPIANHSNIRQQNMINFLYDPQLKTRLFFVFGKHSVRWTHFFV